MALPKYQLSGSPSNPIGLKEFTGEFKTSNGDPAVVQWRVYDKFSDLMNKVYKHGIIDLDRNKAAIFPPGWRPTIEYGYTGNDTGVFNSQVDVHRTGAKSHIGKNITINTEDLTPYQIQTLDMYMKDSGFKRGIEGKINTFTWELDDDTYTDEEQEKAIAEDIRKVVKREVARTEARREIIPRYNTGNDIVDSVLAVDTKLPSPIVFVDSPGQPTAAKHKAAMDSAVKKEAIDIFSVKDIPSDIGNFDKVKSEIASYLKESKDIFYDKRVNNVYSPDHPEIGFMEKYDIPAQIRVYESATRASSKSSAKNYKVPASALIDCFLLRSVSSRFEEKYFVFQSLNGDAISFFFGSKPVVYSFGGVLMDTENQQWFNDFMYYYENYLSGSKSIPLNLRVMMVYDDQIIEGFLLDMNVSKSGDMTILANCSFNMLMTQKTQLKGYQNPDIRNNAVSTPKSATEATMDNKKELLNTTKGTTISASKDNWKASSAAPLTAPPLSQEVINEVKQTNPEVEEERTYGAVDLINSINDALNYPGTLLNQQVLVRAKEDINTAQIKEISNLPSAKSRLGTEDSKELVDQINSNTKSDINNAQIIQETVNIDVDTKSDEIPITFPIGINPVYKA